MRKRDSSCESCFGASEVDIALSGFALHCFTKTFYLQDHSKATTEEAFVESVTHKIQIEFVETLIQTIFIIEILINEES